VLLLAWTACRPAATVPAPVWLEGVRPRERTAVALNEEVLLTFSQPIDPTSVTRDNLFVATPNGDRARGEWRVEGRVVRFLPAPVLARDLSDGGFRPDTSYEVHVLGFPRLDGLRGPAGRPLDRCQRFALHTVSLSGEDVILEDLSPASCGRLWLPQRPDNRGPLVVGSLEPIRILCAEPLDPSTLHDEDFAILATRVIREVDPVTRQPRDRTETCTIPLKGRFRSNAPEGSRPLLEPCAEIELLPVSALQPARTGAEDWRYELRTSARPALADFRGNPAWRARDSGVPLEVVRPARRRQGQLTLQFLDRHGFQLTDLPEYDGLASWSDSGRLEMHFPAAAGDGAQGRVVLTGRDARTDVRATRLAVPSGERAELPEGPGMRILRAQGRLSIDGELLRRGGSGAPETNPFLAGETLTGFLERSQKEGRSWTVLVAGGDLTITGRVDVDTPLLLVAGGWVRISGSVAAPPGQVWLLPRGGGAPDLVTSEPDIVLDPPRWNPLKEELRLAVVTSALPSQEQAYRWTGLEVGGRNGTGFASVRFLPPQGPVEPLAAVDHPGLLPEPGPLRILIELRQPPGGRWDPPSIDYVTLDWEP